MNWKKFYRAAILGSLTVLAYSTVQAASISVSSASGSPGATNIAISINIADGSGLAGGDLVLTYDATALTAKKVDPGALATSSDIMVVGNTNVSGQVKIPMAGARGTSSPSGSLVIVTFDIKPNAVPKDYTLNLTEVSLYNEFGQPISVQNISTGVITVAISGRQ